MNTPPRSTPSPAGDHQAGAGKPWNPSRGGFVVALLFAIALAGLTMLMYLWLSAGASSDGADGAARATPPAPLWGMAAIGPGLAPATPPDGERQPQARAPEGDADPTRDLKSYVARGENPSMPEVLERLHQHGIYTGLGAFSPPGTSPPLVGLAVPEDFVLPEGYVRHHQVTDDGQSIEAILMFHPDYQLYDAAHKPIAMPKDRVVPAELAPPGMPIRRVAIPAPIEPARAGR